MDAGSSANWQHHHLGYSVHPSKIQMCVCNTGRFTNRKASAFGFLPPKCQQKIYVPEKLKHQRVGV